MKKFSYNKKSSFSQKNFITISKTLTKTLYKLNERKKDSEKINLKLNNNKNINNNMTPLQSKFECKSHKNKVLNDLLFTKIKIRARLHKALENNLVLDKEKFQILNIQYKKDNIDLSSQINSKNENKKAVFVNKKHLGLFSDFGMSYNYQDNYKTPSELLKKTFNEKERKIIQIDPAFFKLNKDPFNEIRNTICVTLTDKLLQEDFVPTPIFKYKNLKRRNAFTSAKLPRNEKYGLTNYNNNKSRNKTNKMFRNNNLFRSITSAKSYGQTLSHSNYKIKDKHAYIKSEPNLKYSTYNDTLFDESKSIKSRPLSQKYHSKMSNNNFFNLKEKNLKELQKEYFLGRQIREIVDKIEKIYRAKGKHVIYNNKL